MNNNDIDFQILLRRPKYPVIIVTEEDIYPAFNIKELGVGCYMWSGVADDPNGIKVIDNEGTEFSYLVDQVALMPSLFGKKCTKKDLIELYNKSENTKDSGIQYLPKSLSNKKISTMVNEICEILSQIRNS